MYFLSLFLFLNTILNNFNNKVYELNKELRFYPRWIKNRSTKERIPCKNDNDCPFPSACCNDPFFPFEYCCNGWNKRKLEYAYAKRVIQ